MTTHFQGAALAFEGSLSNELWLILAALVCVYIVLGILYESFIHPVTILSTLPSAGVGALLALMCGTHGSRRDWRHRHRSADRHREEERDHDDRFRPARPNGAEAFLRGTAIKQACLLRLRPILMTTFAAMFGAFPLMLGQGVGAELRQPLGVAIVGGLALSQILTLFTTPVIYLAFDHLAKRLRPDRLRDDRRVVAARGPANEHLGALHKATRRHHALNASHGVRWRRRPRKAADRADARGGYASDLCFCV